MNTELKPWAHTFVVRESCDDYEQVLGLLTGPDLPAGGVLSWAGPSVDRVGFPSREDARAAIHRTEHYRLAFGRNDLPEKKHCSVSKLVVLSRPPQP